ncbi:hypothetical protein RYA95_22700 [Pseudomonas syringae pv. actinidiae]|uniref:hypothetical protein n=1 Tax=Pseudomonas syringae TaxID=317 RepID=UPI0009AFAA3F|nr:hypothetical protein [Pseudomonas syringae]AYL79222.1 hypothetical protein CN228_04085 [Pseudomonas syringae pv. actinidiae str. Shaanxi_M228]MDU8615873.1 hypothetical protein [Pseudomonas syringae pv. actinidiae]
MKNLGCRSWVSYFENSTLAFAISRYDMPLYPITSWLVDHSYQYFGHYQDDTYESGADPVTFISLMVIIFVYSLILYSLLRWLLKKMFPL